MIDVPEIFASMVFSEKVMKERLDSVTYNELLKTKNEGAALKKETADIIAGAMKSWAIEKGATHYTHWFQPMTGITAEKHDSFISPDGEGGVIMEFSGKELIKGEPDASSFPSGGLRATFEARGYTAWDPTSYAFIKDNTLCIPTAFCSYNGEVLDKKTPLLRSMEVIDKQAVRILHLFGKKDVRHVIPTVGAEQEYFLIDEAAFNKRKDLVYTGRTLFGCPSPKEQQLDDHYFGQIKPRIYEFMKELDEELWKLGIYAKTEHNEAAPAQHELAPVFSSTNIATDHNQLTMEFMKKIAQKHHMVCLLHEKPFAGVNGSGKHNNWSLATDKGENLFEPGSSPYENAQFLLFFSAFISAADKHQDLLRLSAANAGNDHRLGGAEAPPAIVSMFIGDDLDAVLNSIKNGTEYTGCEKSSMEIGVMSLPKIPKDTTDRNRTSPLAFTGNKFEFRMLGSSASIACTNTILNTIVADELSIFADRLERADDFMSEVNRIVKESIKNHGRIIFNGNGYSDEWVKEAKRRGLLNLPTAVEALKYYVTEENIALFERHGVYTKNEVEARYEILLEEYSKIVDIEARTMLGMVRKDYIPAVSLIESVLCETIIKKKTVSEKLTSNSEQVRLEKISALAEDMYTLSEKLSLLLSDVPKAYEERAAYYRDTIVPVMQSLRSTVDEIEMRSDRRLWPVPSYGDVMFSVR